MSRLLSLVVKVSAVLAVSAALAAPANPATAVSPRVKAELGTNGLRDLVPAPVEVHTVDPSLLRPDLVVSDVVWSQATYLPPVKLQVTCTIRNDGTADAGPFHVSCSGAGVIMADIVFVSDGLKRGASVPCPFSFQYTAGPEPAMAFVDYCNEVVESNETNNVRYSKPTLDASAYDFYAQEIQLAYLPNSPEAVLFGDGPVTQPVDGMPLVLKATFGYINKVDQKPLTYSTNIYIDGVIQKSYKVTIPANGSVEVLHPIMLAGGDHTLKIGPSGIHVDQTWPGNELEKTYHWRTRAKGPYRCGYFAVNRYDLIGGGGNLSSYAVYEGRRFGIRMKELGHWFTQKAENADINWPDWGGGPTAKANQVEIAYFGHGNQDGPFYSQRAFDGTTDRMGPANFRFGLDAAGKPSARWIVWSACETLYDGKSGDQINWTGDGNSLDRWFQCYNGLHAIVGMRSKGWVGWWDDVLWWGDTSQRGPDFVNLISDGHSFSWAWYLANRWCVWDECDVGFESAVLYAVAEGTDYTTERFTATYPDYTTPPTGYYYEAWRIGSPNW